MRYRDLKIRFAIAALAACLLINSTYAAKAAPPPSVALRTEVSYVNIVLLESVNHTQNGSAQLNVELLEDLHNHAQPRIVINATPGLAAQLEVGSEYVVAYYSVKKIRDNELKHYQPLSDGPELMHVDGAYPAIFKRNAHLIQQLTSSPELAQSDPDTLIQNIFSGMAATDPVIKAFFVREIINWDALHSSLKTKHYQSLYQALISPNATPDTVSALLESRENLHSAIGVKRIGAQAHSILQGMSVNLDINGQEPTMVLNALIFAESHQLADWHTISRWTRANIPTLAERALLLLASLDADKALELARQRVTETRLNQATRRAVQRFITSRER